ncbi:MAG: selenide, water dikinase SelD [Betaproteobacteria bacterium]|nr:selenide, water dikinase SelD [Betaproteobacteria bacterium]
MSDPISPATGSARVEPRLTSLSHGGGCGCKIAPGVLGDILRRHAPQILPPQLMVGIETADDAAVWRLSDSQALVATTDFFMPIVDDPADFGAIAATNAISDVYAMGARPLLALAIVGMPIAVLGPETIASILRGGQDACARAGIPVAGGHSIDSVEPIYGLAVIGIGHPDRIRRNRDARDGDLLVLGKGLGVGIYSAALKKDRLDAEGYRHMLDATTRLNTPGPLLADIDEVHAITDVTGFGLLGHALELCRGAGLGARIRADAVPLLPGVRELAASGLLTGASARNWNSYGGEVDMDSTDPLARSLFTDPQTAGGLLLSCAPSALPRVLEVFRAEGFEHAAVIGEMHAGQARVRVV